MSLNKFSSPVGLTRPDCIYYVANASKKKIVFAHFAVLNACFTGLLAAHKSGVATAMHTYVYANPAKTNIIRVCT